MTQAGKQLQMFKNIVLASKNWNKCFGIGANKTGSSTLNFIMKQLYGLRADQLQTERFASVQAMRGNYAALVSCMQNLDFHQDLPVSQGQTYVALDALFPNSKFILTVRDEGSWARSFSTFYFDFIAEIVLDNWLARPQHYCYVGYINKFINQYYHDAIKVLMDDRSLLDALRASPDNKALFAEHKDFIYKLQEAYMTRNAMIIEYFRGRQRDLLVLDIGKLQGLSPISRFLGIPDIIRSKIPIMNSRDAASTHESLDITFEYGEEFIEDFIKV
jgi:hypothetical protein